MGSGKGGNKRIKNTSLKEKEIFPPVPFGPVIKEIKKIFLLEDIIIDDNGLSLSKNRFFLYSKINNNNIINTLESNCYGGANSQVRLKWFKNIVNDYNFSFELLANDYSITPNYDFYMQTDPLVLLKGLEDIKNRAVKNPDYSHSISLKQNKYNTELNNSITFSYSHQSGRYVIIPCVDHYTMKPGHSIQLDNETINLMIKLFSNPTLFDLYVAEEIIHKPRKLELKRIKQAEMENNYENIISSYEFDF